jgi:phenylacetate-CoA ligase
MIWNKEFETMSSKELRGIQSQRLRDLVSRVYSRVPFYQEKMKATGVKPSDIQSIEDIDKLPFITKDELRSVYPYGLLATDMKNIVEIHTSSGNGNLR